MAFPNTITAFPDIPDDGDIPMDEAEEDGVNHDEYEEQQSAAINALETEVLTARITGATSPEASVIGRPGKTYLQVTATERRLWVKVSGSGNTGWEMALEYPTPGT